MNVIVQLHNSLLGRAPDGRQRPFEVTILSGSSLGELIADLGINLSMESVRFEVNGRAAGPETILEAGDQVELMPTD